MPTEVRLVKATIFPVVMYWCESWTIKKAECRRIDAFELWCWRRLLRVPWTARRSNQSILKGNQFWIFTGRTDAEAETPILWLSDVKNWLIWKDPDAWKDWRQEEKGMTEEEMARWHHHLAKLMDMSWVGDRQGNLACCSPMGLLGHKWVTELNWTLFLNKITIIFFPTSGSLVPTKKVQSHTSILTIYSACVMHLALA